ncbi:Relaxin-3 Insulin-like peptide INSL7 [Triplophysa tibetana]|uniref:Relaxin-3 Insulin-like peptide INSL7 n=1 Tax=Triplophysa tibetana TaxID=1572043 RepID=A0A5A9PA65_9TELE|nr:Relaxin-3 Insulin-like peptide INSL7 [Triplophysa tibetana]
MRVVLLVVVLLFAVWADSAQSQKALRLCGREFFRAVVYTCGGSRWRRVQNENNVKGFEMVTGKESFTTTAEMDRGGRDLDSLLPLLCCKVGCHKNDLALLC